MLRPARATALARRWFIESLRVLGPIFQIEAVLTVRRARYYLLRASYGSLLLLVLWSCYSASGSRSQITLQSAAEFGTAFFYSFAVAQLIVSLVVAAAVTAGTIAEERERRTIEYLFATDLSNSEIVLGKLAARLLLILVFLLTGLPVLSIALLFGGIDADNLVQLLVVTASTVTAAAALSICLSVWTRRPRDAIMRAFIVLLGLIILPWPTMFLAFLRADIYAWIVPINEQLLIGNPFVFLVVMAGVGGPLAVAATPGWTGVAELVRNHFVVSITMIALAVWQVRRVHLGAAAQPARPAAGRWNWRLWRPALGERPMLWKELFAERSVKDLGLMGRIVVVLLFLAILAPIGWLFFKCLLDHQYYRPEDFQDVANVLGIIIGCLFLLVLAARAATSVTTEKEKQCWDALISTPLGGSEIVLGKTLGNLFALRWIMALFAVIWGMAVVLGPRAFWPGALMALTIALLSPFFSGMGLFISLRSRNSTRAMCWSMLVAILLGGGYLIFVAPLREALVAVGIIHRHQQDVVFIGSASYLVAWPGMDHRPQDADTPLYVLGMSGYVVLGVFLSLVNVLRFDRLVGRPAQSPYRIKPARSIGPPHADGEAKPRAAIVATGAPP